MKVQVVIYDETDGGKKELLATTDAFNNKLSVILKGRQKAYRMKLVYNGKNSKNTCVVYDLQVAMKPLKQVATENLLCEGSDTPPELFNINDPFFKINRKFSLSGEYLTRDKPTSYDFLLVFAHSDYMLDVEIKTDFLSTDFGLEAYIKDEANDSFIKIA